MGVISGDSVLRLITPHLPGLVNLSSIKPDTNLWNAGVDSLSSVSIMVAVEDEFDVVFPDELLTREVFSSAAAIATAIRSLIDDPDCEESA